MKIEQRLARRILWGLFAFFLAFLIIGYCWPSICPVCHCNSNAYWIYGAVGTIIGLVRSCSGTKGLHDCARNSPFWICCGLGLWTFGQMDWTSLVKVCPAVDEPVYPGWPDLPWLLAIAVWTFLGLRATFVFLDRDVINDVIGGHIYKFAVLVWGALEALVIQLDTKNLTPKFVADSLYVLLTTSACFLVVVLIHPPKQAAPQEIVARPMNRALNFFLIGATLHMVANFAFILTYQRDSFLARYEEGNWIDWLLLGAIHWWCLGVVEYPVGRNSGFYLISTYPTEFSQTNVQQAKAMFDKYIPSQPGEDPIWRSSDWILREIPKCWVFATYCGNVVGSALVLPVSSSLMSDFLNKRKNERQLFEASRAEPRDWSSLYLVAAAVQPGHRGLHLALECLLRAIRPVKDTHNPNIELFGWPVSLGGAHLLHGLEERLGVHVSAQTP